MKNTNLTNNVDVAVENKMEGANMIKKTVHVNSNMNREIASHELNIKKRELKEFQLIASNENNPEMREWYLTQVSELKLEVERLSVALENQVVQEDREIVYESMEEVQPSFGEMMEDEMSRIREEVAQEETEEESAKTPKHINRKSVVRKKEDGSVSTLKRVVENKQSPKKRKQKRSTADMRQKDANRKALDRKIDQKMMNIVKGDSFATIYRAVYDNGQTEYKFSDFKEDSSIVRRNKFTIAVISDNVESEYFSQYSMSAGMLDAHLKLEHVKAARIESNDGRSEVAYLDKEMLVDHESIAVEVDGAQTTEVYIMKEEDMGEIRRYMNWEGEDRADMSIVGGFKEVIGEGQVWKVGARSASQTRQSDLVLIPDHKSYVEHMNELNFFIDSYAELTEDGKAMVSTGLQSRLKMSASSGKWLGLFKDLEFISVEDVEFAGFDDETVIGQHYKFRNGNKGIIDKLVLRQDFEVKLLQEIIAPGFNEDTATEKERIEVLKSVEEFTKEATDGSSYADADYMKSIGIVRDLQVRITPVIKGMLNNVKGLKEKLGFDFVYFGGAVKGDPAPYFKSNDIQLYILGMARLELEGKENYLMLSNQLVRELEKRNPKTLDVFESQSKNILQRAFNQDIDALKVFVGLEEERGNTLTEEERRILDEENMTAELFYRNAKVFMKSAGFMKRLSDFIRKSTQSVENAGRYYSPDSSFKHMVSDPYEVVRHMSKGRMAFDMNKSDDMMGIAPGYVVSSRKINGKYLIDTRKAVLGRFPMLHHLEIQVVNEGTEMFLSNEMHNLYQGQIMQGYHQGMIYYSLYDMTAEAQSGADFDGDTTVVIRFEDITKLMTAMPKFLDYSYLNGVLVEGVPWKEDNFTKLSDIVKPETYEALMNKGVEYHEGLFTMDKELLQDEIVQEGVMETIVKLDAMTNEVNNIGQFTNINSAVNELITLLEEKRALVIEKGELNLAQMITDEMRGYKKLNFLIASAIRWEIDKAKHGGQFYKQMTFLGALLNANEMGQLGTLLALEKRYGIKLTRLFKGFANSNDLINQGLDKLGIPRIHLKRSEWDKGGLNSSRTIQLGKGLDKGADYGTRYSRYIQDMTALADKHTRDIFVNEYKHGLLQEAEALISYMAAKGITIDVEPAYNASMAVIEHGKIDTPERLLWSYKEQTSEIQKELNNHRGELENIYRSQVRGDVVNIEKLSLEVLMKKIHLPEEERKPIYALIAQRELIMDEHKGKGEELTPDCPYKSALLVASLYANNVRIQNGLREDAAKDENKVYEAKRMLQAKLKKDWEDVYGDALPNKEQSTTIKNHIHGVDKNGVPNYAKYLHSDSGLSSIVTLFPLGMVQFFELLNHGDIITESTRGINTSVFMKLINERGEEMLLTPEMKQLLKNAEGSEIEIKNGRWGILSVDREDLAGRNRNINVSPREMEHLQNKENYEKVSEMIFERGAHLWNRNRKGKVVLATIHDSGVKLFLEDTKVVSPE